MKKCLDCNSVKSDKGSYCKPCGYKHRVRPTGLVYTLRKENPTAFKKGHKPWSMGTKGLVTAWNKGLKGSHFSVGTEFQPGGNVGSLNTKWKGNDVGYHALHSWVRRQLGKAIKCTRCESLDNVQWANKSFEYKREVGDWLELCFKCHRQYDSRNGWGLATKKFPELQLKRVGLR